MKTQLRIENIEKSFRISKKQMKDKETKFHRRKAVNDLSFQAFEGEVFGLLGPNGAGKTTTLRMIATLIKPDAGHIYIRDKDIIKNNLYAKKKIGFLTNEMKLDGYFTPNYIFDFFSSLYDVPDSVRKKRKKELFEKFEIESFANERIQNLSTGTKQKVSLAVSLIHDPEIIVFDEPTNGLDIITAKVIFDFLEHLKKAGKTIILSTHIFDLAEGLCDRIGIIIDGKMVLCEKKEILTEENSLETVFFETYHRIMDEKNEK